MVVDHILACDAPGLHRAALAAWARLFNGQQSRSAIEYREIERAEAETRGAELERVLDALRSGSHVRGRAIEALASSMRNDLQVVMTSSALGQDGGHWHEAYQPRKLSRESFLSLGQALSNLVVLAHLEAGNEACRVEDFDAGHGLRQLADALQHLAAPRGVRLEADGPEGLAVAGDPERVRRIARHLLACALQAPAPGTVALRWAVAEPALTRWQLVVEHDVDATAAGSETGRALALATDAAQQVVGTPPTGRETELAEGCIPVAPGDGVDLLIATSATCWAAAWRWRPRARGCATASRCPRATARADRRSITKGARGWACPEAPGPRSPDRRRGRAPSCRRRAKAGLGWAIARRRARCAWMPAFAGLTGPVRMSIRKSADLARRRRWAMAEN